MSQNSNTRIVVGMSGGVDSSVSAALLLEQGYQVDGLFMKNWEEDDTDEFCTATQDRHDAQAVCDKLGIRLHCINFAAEYWDGVFEHFLQEYAAGRTPNPDILCNREIKFKVFLQYARKLGAHFMATGHYAQRREVKGQFELVRGLDANKDQSYFLYTLGQNQLAQSLFPVGALAKPQVRTKAEQLDLITHNKKDSTGICFIGERKFRDFLAQYLPAQPGEICALNGTVVGRHQGLMYYTLGQRKGLGIGGVANFPEQPWFVVAKQLEHNRLWVTQGLDHPALYAPSLQAAQVSWVAGQAPADDFHCTAKIRYRQQDEACRVQVQGEQLRVDFTAPQRAITPGQSIVFYQNDVCLGGAVIETVIGGQTPW